MGKKGGSKKGGSKKGGSKFSKKSDVPAGEAPTPEQLALKAKNAANKAFAAGEFKSALELFTEAINHTPDAAVLYSNRSAVNVKLSLLPAALDDANKCVELDPAFLKGYSRQGHALQLMGKFPEAIAAYAVGLAKDPTDEVLLKGMTAAQAALVSPKKKKRSKGRKKKAAEAADAVDEEPVEQQDHVIGIDLGTTYSCVGVWLGDEVEILTTDSGERTIPSYVAFEGPELTRLTGHAAKNQATRNPMKTVYDIKRIIGQGFSASGVEQDIRHFPFPVVKGEDDKPVVEIQSETGEKRQFAPEQISAFVLSQCKEIAEKRLGCDVNKAVITVPAYFNDAQRNATKAAGVIAGLEVLRIINEPTAAALSYGLDNLSMDKGEKTNVLIFDLGGGTFDVSILSIEKGIFTVVATGGDTRLGGEDFDKCSIEHLLQEIEKEPNCPKDLRANLRAMQRIRTAAEAAKRQLSKSQSALINLENLEGDFSFKYNFTRSKFEALNKAGFTLCMEVVRRVLKDAKLKPADIQELVLVGGSTRIPKVQENLSDFFGGKRLCKSLNPDEAVAYGAAVQGAILNGKRNKRTKDVLLMDVTPLSLGIETTGRVMSVIIPRNTPIPCVKTQTYTTENNYQTKVDISVYEGERLKSDENNLLGEFTISGIESAKRGEPQIDVSFSIDSDGIVNVKAVDQKTMAQANIEIANRSRASDADIERMVKEAEKYKADDLERVRRIEAINELEQAIAAVMEASEEVEDAKLAAILQEAADREQEWMDEGNCETAKVAEIAKRRRALMRRIENRRNQ
jgi:L1 cell adhesion molecule like protein